MSDTTKIVLTGVAIAAGLMMLNNRRNSSTSGLQATGHNKATASASDTPNNQRLGG